MTEYEEEIMSEYDMLYWIFPVPPVTPKGMGIGPFHMRSDAVTECTPGSIVVGIPVMFLQITTPTLTDPGTLL